MHGFEGLIFASDFPNAVRTESPCGEEECHLLRAAAVCSAAAPPALPNTEFYGLDPLCSVALPVVWLFLWKKKNIYAGVETKYPGELCGLLGCRVAWP